MMAASTSAKMPALTMCTLPPELGAALSSAGVPSTQTDPASSPITSFRASPAPIADVPIKLFPAANFVELVGQRLRAQGYKRKSFEDFVQLLEKHIKQQDWGTDYFEIFDRSASAGQFEPE